MNYTKENIVYRCVNNSYLCRRCVEQKLDQFKILGSGPYFNGQPIDCSACGTKLHSIQGEGDAGS